MMWRKVALAVCIVLTLPILLAEARAGAALLGPIAVYTGLDYNFAPAFVATEKGFFQEHGIDARVQNFQSGALAISAIRSARGGYVLAGDLPSLRTWATGDIVGIAPLAWSDAALSIVAKKGINSAADLRGKRVGITFTASDMIFFARYLIKHGLQRTDVSMINLSGSDMVAAFVRGEIDVVFSNIPVTSKALQAVAGSHYIQRGIAGFGANRVIVNAMRATVEGDPRLTQGVLAAFADAVRYMRTDSNEAIKIVAAKFGVPADVARKNVDLFHYSMVFDKTFVDDLTAESQFGIQLELLKAPVDWSTQFNPKFLAAIDKTLVRTSP